MTVYRNLRIIVAVVALASASCGGSTTTITGEIELHDDSVDISGTSCSGTGGYDDMRGGASVTVTDGTGTIIGTSRLDAGKRYSYGCLFEFTVDVPGDSEFYTVEVSHRGGLTYSNEEMEAVGWTMQLSLG